MPKVPEREPAIFPLVTEAECADLVAGKVSESVEARARCAIDWEFRMAANAAKPDVGLAEQLQHGKR
jgi:hypothetical protein